MTASKTQVIAIGGPTASGKSSLAMALGGLVSVELLNFDSMQIYREMDIGTAKPGKEDRETVPHHLLDLRDPDELFSVGQYTPLFRETVEDIARRGFPPRIEICGFECWNSGEAPIFRRFFTINVAMLAP